jgi:hypothetical protein
LKSSSQSKRVSPIFTEAHRAVSGIICINPTAPLGETAMGLKLLSAPATANMNNGSSPYFLPAASQIAKYRNGAR